MNDTRFDPALEALELANKFERIATDMQATGLPGDPRTLARDTMRAQAAVLRSVYETVNPLSNYIASVLVLISPLVKDEVVEWMPLTKQMGFMVYARVVMVNGDSVRVRASTGFEEWVEIGRAHV